MAQPADKANAGDQTSGTGCLVRLGWMALGNAALVVCLIVIVGHGKRFFSVADAVFWCLVPFLIWLRRLDVTRMNGQTVAGQRATLVHWKRYTLLLLVLSVIAWAAAHAVGWL